MNSTLRRLTWDSSLLRPFESAWSSFARICLLNDLTQAELKIKREGIVLEVEASEGSKWLLPRPVRIAMHPETDADTGMKSLLDFCATERAELMKHLGQPQKSHGIESKLDTETP